MNLVFDPFRQFKLYFLGSNNSGTDPLPTRIPSINVQVATKMIIPIHRVECESPSFG